MHFCTYVFSNTPTEVEKLLAPFQENNMGDCPKEFLEFYDASADPAVIEEYENGNIRAVKNKMTGEILSYFNEKFWPPRNAGAATFSLPENWEVVQIPYKEECATFEQYLEEEGYNIDPETHKYGFWDNPNSQWDWYQKGGRYNPAFCLKKGGNTNQAKIKEIDHIPPSWAFITPDGKWNDQRGNRDLFMQKLYALAEKEDNQELWVTAIDCHI